MMKYALAVIALVFLALPASAGVYVTDQVDPTSAFCQAVSTTRDVYCPQAHVKCTVTKKGKKHSRKMKMKDTVFAKAVHLCMTDPGKISEEAGAKLMQSYQENQSAICCMADIMHSNKPQ